MEALKRGSHAPRVSVACSACGAGFMRSAVHPYVTECPGCREAARASKRAAARSEARLKCASCRRLVSGVSALGPHSCGARGCDREWWSLGGGWWRDTATDRVFRLGDYRGSLREAPFEEVFRGARDDVRADQVLDRLG